MATVDVAPSPRTALAMSSKRTPLASVPNAANSPRHAVPHATKRQRPGSQIEIPYGQPPLKRQLLDRDENSCSPTKSHTHIVPPSDARIFSSKLNKQVQPTAFEKKLVAARDKDTRDKERVPQTKVAKNEKPSTETLDTIRQWQKHYRKAFPQFVFYFDTVPEDVRYRCSRQCMALGAVSFDAYSSPLHQLITV
jgi:regulatory subunit for Cdc7p protein kinase